MDELKPCPFCGEEAELSSGRFDGKDTSYVVCKRCGSIGEFFFVSPKYTSAERAIEAWNRRQPQRMRGKWNGYKVDNPVWQRDDGTPVFIICSECKGMVINNVSANWNYCPNCGAEMEMVEK